MNILQEAAPMQATAATESRAMQLSLVLGTALAFAGQALLLRIVRGSPDEGAMQALGGSLLMAGALLFGLATRHTYMTQARLEFPREQVSRPALTWRNRWTISLLSAAVALSGIAIGMFITSGETLATVTVWLMSMLALFVAQVPRIRLQRPSLTRKELLFLGALLVLLLIALITRIYELTTLPNDVDGDFASVGLQARSLVTGGEHHIFAYGWAAVPILGYIPPWITMALFGTGLAGLNMSGVIEGLLIIIGVYLLGRDLFHARIGLIAASLLTISYTHLAASRQSSYIDPALFLVFAIYFLIVGLREGRGGATVISGMLTALCLQMYYSGRIVIFIVAFILIYLLLFRRSWLWARLWAVLLWAVLLWALALIVALGPMLVVFAREFDAFMERTRAVFILNPEIVKHMEGVYHVTTIPELMLQQLRHTALMFNYYADSSTQFDVKNPFLDPFTASLFVLGIGYALFHWRRFGAAFMLAWAVLGMVVGCLLTVNAPFWPRPMVLLPPAVLLPALAIDPIYDLAKRALARLGNSAAPFVPASLVLILVAVGVMNWNIYVEAKGDHATPRARIGRYLMDQPSSTRGYLISDYFGSHDREFEFLVPERLVADLRPEQVTENIDRVGTPTLLFLTAEQSELTETLPRLFPGGSVETVTGNAPDEVAFYVFHLP